MRAACASAAMLLSALPVAAGCRVERSAPPPTGETSQSATAAAIPPSVRYDQHLSAGGNAPPGADARNPFADNAKSAVEGAKLFSSMNCDGCHASGEGWVGPSLSDGRWRYGASDAAVFQSIFYGRPRGMPAFGGLLSPVIIWKLVTYIRSLPLPKAVPTQAW